MLQLIIIAGFLLSIGLVLAMARKRIWGDDQLLRLVWTSFAIAILSFGVYGLSEGRLGYAGWIFGVLSSVTCGLAWLLSRALFRTSVRADRWPFMVVGVLLITGLAADVFNFSDVTNSLTGALNTVHTLLSSTVLLMALIEPLIGLPKTAKQTEKMFRITFAVGYGLILSVGYIWLRGAAEGDFALQWSREIRLICALIALFAGGAAVWHRSRYPYLSRFKGDASTEDEKRLADRIHGALCDDDRFTSADLKVADIAALLGAPEHKISRAITTHLGFANFNRLVNHYRIERACNMLSDPQFQDLPVLTIAMDSGFGSIGPFNRSFKDATGMTPSAYRRSKLPAAAATAT